MCGDVRVPEIDLGNTMDIRRGNTSARRTSLSVLMVSRLPSLHGRRANPDESSLTGCDVRLPDCEEPCGLAFVCSRLKKPPCLSP